MKNYRTHKSSLFLIELILALAREKKAIAKISSIKKRLDLCVR